MNKITYSEAIQFLNAVVLEGLRQVADNKYILAEKNFIKAVKITRQLNKLKKIEQRDDIVKRLTLENQELKKEIKEKDKKIKEDKNITEKTKRLKKRQNY